MSILNRKKLEITVFTSGLVVMVYEIVGSRVLSPYLGSSIYVWTSLIGIILASLSLGYMYGGRKADKSANYEYLSNVIFFSAVLIFLTNIVKESVLEGVTQVLPDLRLSAIVSSAVLFAPASILLGFVSPYAVRLKLDNIETGGETIGNMYALSTLGSIVGTFLAGFVLFLFLRTTQLLFVLSLILVLISALLVLKTKKFKKHLIFIAILLYSIYADAFLASVSGKFGYVDTDTQYSRVWIKDARHKETEEEVRILFMDSVTHSAAFIGKDDLVHEYGKYFDLSLHFKPDLKETLLLGGGAYSYPKYFTSKYPDKNMDVVEIDPGLTELSKEYFNLSERENLVIYHEDARTFMNNLDKTYDAIYMDAFGRHGSPPFQLTTLEFANNVFDHLTEDGVVVLNIISGVEGEYARLFASEYITYKMVFDNLFVFVPRDIGLKEPQNIMLVATKGNVQLPLSNPDEYLQAMLENRIEPSIHPEALVLTDNYAPVEYISKIAPRWYALANSRSSN